MNAAGTMMNHVPRINHGASKRAPKIPNLPSELPKINKPTIKIMNDRIIRFAFVLTSFYVKLLKFSSHVLYDRNVC